MDKSIDQARRLKVTTIAKLRSRVRSFSRSYYYASRNVAIALSVALLSHSLPTEAQTIAGISPTAPPEFAMRDLGVNLSTTDIELQHVDISVGSGEFPARLDLVRTYDMIGLPNLNLGKFAVVNGYHGFGPGGQHNLLAYFTCEACNTGDPTKRIINMTVVMLGKSYHFTGAGPTGSNAILLQDDDVGATMQVIDPSASTWTYQLTTKDGTKAIFSNLPGYKYDPFGGLFAKYVEFPNGEFLTFQYAASPFASGVVRLSSITNSRGYGLAFSYGSVATSIGLAGATSDPSLISSITSTKTTNGAGQVSLASVSYAYDSTGNLTSVTDLAGGVTRYQYDTYLRLTNVFQPANTSSSPSLSIGYQNGISQVTTASAPPFSTFYGSGAGTTITLPSDNNVDVQWSTPASVTDAVGNVTYFGFSDPTAPDPISVTVINPDASTRRYSTIFCAASPNCPLDPYFMKAPTTAVSELGAVTTYTYDSRGRIISRTLPEGGSDALVRDANGNVIQQTKHAKPGSGFPDISTSAGYATCNAGNKKICNKPTYSIDARGGRWDFQYDPLSGQLAVSLAPADANNLRAVTRYSYGSVAPGPAALPPGIVAPTIYVLTAKDECLSSGVTGATIDFSYTCSAGNRRRTLYNYAPSTQAAPSSFELASTVDDSDSAAALTQYAYDAVGNVVSITNPNGNASFVKYDAMRRKSFEIGPDPDGSGPLPRLIVHHVYDADGNEIRTESGTGMLTDGTDFTLVRFNRMTYDSNDRLVKIEEVVP